MRTIDGVLPDDACTGEIVQRNDDYWVYDDGIWARVPTAAARRIRQQYGEIAALNFTVIELERDLVSERAWQVPHIRRLEAKLESVTANRDALAVMLKHVKGPWWHVMSGQNTEPGSRS